MQTISKELATDVKAYVERQHEAVSNPDGGVDSKMLANELGLSQERLELLLLEGMNSGWVADSSSVIESLRHKLLQRAPQPGSKS